VGRKRWPGAAGPLLVPWVIGGLTSCGPMRTGDYNCGPQVVSFSVHGHTYEPGGCAAQYRDLGWVTVKAGSAFTAQVPEKGYPLPDSSDSAVVRSVSRSDRHERFRAIAPGVTTLTVLSGACYRAPVVQATRGVAPTPLSHPPLARCTLLRVHVTAPR
jgi:hypothetical protein